MKELNEINISFLELPYITGHADLSAIKKLNKYIKPNKTIIIHTENGSEATSIFNNVQALMEGVYY